MAQIKTEKQYNALLKRVEYLLEVVKEDTPSNDPDFIELDVLADLVEEYEIDHYPVEEPVLADVIKLRMFEMGINQTKLSELLELSPSRVSEYLTGKSEPTLSVARNISRKLGINPSIVLGV
ncbi:MAG: helix-turn-helix domain-containing protein [Flavobacteriaceae bacterium]|jgi:HTH-type transcriptional regulator/antitoxin HigA|nr:helix-turn-helix domain-containing protein [Flavobacteriaceae bacterium]